MPKKLGDFSKIYRHQMIYNVLRMCSEDSALSVTEIHLRLIKDGLDVSTRTVNRDLEEMSGTHRLQSTETVPIRFYTSADFKPDYQLNFNEEELQTIILALEGLKQMSPDYLKDLCQKTETTLIGKLPKDVSKSFDTLKAMSHVAPAFASEAVSRDRESFGLVMTALRDGVAFECQYLSPYKDEKYNQQKRLFFPLLLNMSGGEPYLFIQDAKDKTVKKIKIARLRSVKVLEQKVDKSILSQIKNLDKIIGGYGGLNEPVIKYQVTCDKEMADLLDERRIHHSQVIKAKGDKFVITFEANDSLEIIRYLSGYGDHMHDVKPAEAYEKIKQIWRSGLKAA